MLLETTFHTIPHLKALKIVIKTYLVSKGLVELLQNKHLVLFGIGGDLTLDQVRLQS